MIFAPSGKNTLFQGRLVAICNESLRVNEACGNVTCKKKWFFQHHAILQKKKKVEFLTDSPTKPV